MDVLTSREVALSVKCGHIFGPTLYLYYRSNVMTIGLSFHAPSFKGAYVQLHCVLHLIARLRESVCVLLTPKPAAMAA